MSSTPTPSNTLEISENISMNQPPEIDFQGNIIFKPGLENEQDVG